MRRVKEIEGVAFVVGRGETVGDEHDLAVRRVLGREDSSRSLQGVLNVREVPGDVEFGQLRITHIRFESDDRIEYGHRLRHQPGDFRNGPRLSECIHLDELQEVTGVFAANQAIEGESHPFHVHVLIVVSHRTGHIEQHAGCGFGRVPRCMNENVVGLQSHGECLLAEQGVDEAAGHVHVGDGIAEFVLFGSRRFGGPIAFDGVRVPAGATGLHVVEDRGEHAGLEQAECFGRHLELILGVVPVHPLPFGFFFDVVFNLLLQRSQGIQIGLLDELREFLKVDDADLGVLLRVLQLFEQLFD